MKYIQLLLMTGVFYFQVNLAIMAQNYFEFEMITSWIDGYEDEVYKGELSIYDNFSVFTYFSEKPEENIWDIENQKFSKELAPEFNPCYTKDFENEVLLSHEVILEDNVFVSEPLPKMDWTILQETSMKASYSCVKATTHFRGRDYTAWFTPDIAISNGPWKFGGLPGMILEVYDTNREVYFGVTKMSQVEDLQPQGCDFPDEEPMTWEEYSELAAKKMERLKMFFEGKSDIDLEVNAKMNTLEQSILDGQN